MSQLFPQVSLRAFTACLLSLLMLMAPMAPLAASVNRSAAAHAEQKAARKLASSAKKQMTPQEALESALFVNPLPPLPPVAPNITATLSDSFIDTTPVSTRADPGSTVTYTAVVTNSGSDATGVIFTDTPDPNTTLVPGSIKISPLAFADTYSAIINTPLNVVAPGVLTNDTGTPAPTAVPIAAGPTTAGGTVTLNANGSFAYNPPNATFTGADTFTYSATNTQAPNDTATVTINVDAPPKVTSTTPIQGATQIGTGTNITLNFSESVNIAAGGITVNCAGAIAFAPALPQNGVSSIIIDPTPTLPVNTLCTVTGVAANITDVDTNDPPNTLDGNGDGVEGDNFTLTFTTDAAPTVTSTVPTDTATGVATNATITINFSESVSASGTAFTLECPAGTPKTFSQSASPASSFTLTPTVALPANTTCKVTVVALQITDTDTGDPPDNMAANFVFNFTTDAAPTVTTTVPTDGANPVATNTNITVNFSEAVNATTSSFTIECPNPGNLQTFTVSGSGASTITLDPTADLPVGTVCTVTVIAAQITDTDTNDPPDNMVTNFVFSFTTDSPPSVTTTVPANNATDVTLAATITINFSENVNVAAGGVAINCGGVVAFTPALPQSNLTSLVLTPTGGLPAGSDCTVTVDKTKISDTDTADPPDNMVADKVFTFKVKPDAINDTYSQTVIGNVNVDSASIPFSVTSNNDVSAAAFTISAFDATTTSGGQVVMTTSGANMGKFTYNPPPGFEGTDTFTYTISRTDGGGTDTATVSVPVSGMIWFIKDGAAACTTLAGGCGRLSNPFSTLAAFNTLNTGVGNNPAANDNIFIYTGAGNYTAPLTLLNNQRVIGQGATSSLATLAGVTVPSGSAALPATGGTDPTITNGSGNGFNLASGNQLYGLKFLSTSSTAINGGVNVGTFIMGDIIVDNSGSAGAGIVLNNGGTSVTSSGVNTIATGAGTALNVSSTTIGAGGMTFRSISANGGTNGIILSSTGAGGLTVTGTGTTDGSGGTIQNISVRGASFISANSISLSNMTFTLVGTTNGADPNNANSGCGDLVSGNNLSCNAGIHLQTVTGATFTNVDMNNNSGGSSSGQIGINGDNVTNFVLSNSNVLNFGNETREDGLKFHNMLGTSSISGTTISGNEMVQVQVENDTGTLTKLDVSNTTISTSAAPNGNHGILFDTHGSATAKLQVQGTTFLNLFSNCIDALGDGATGGMTVVIDGTTGSPKNSFTGCGASAITIAQNGAAPVSFNITGNGTLGSPTFLGGTSSHAININQAGSAPQAAVMQGAITNNFIGNASSSTSSTVGGVRQIYGQVAKARDNFYYLHACTSCR